MGFTASTEQITFNVLTGDGQGGFWYVGQSSAANNSEINKMGYLSDGVIRHPGNLYGFATFRLLLLAMVQNSIPLPSVEVNINAQGQAERENVQDQFQDPALTDADLAVLAGVYNVENFCKFFGVFELVRRFYLLSLMTLQQLADVFIHLGQNRKITEAKVRSSTDWLLANSHITQGQYDNFWSRWTNEVTT